MKSLISIGVALFILYIIAFSALAISIYAILRINNIEQEPITKIMIISPSPVPTISIIPVSSSSPTLKIASPSAVKAK